MPSRNVILADINGNQIAPATTAEQVQYNEEMNVKQAIDDTVSFTQNREYLNGTASDSMADPDNFVLLGQCEIPEGHNTQGSCVYDGYLYMTHHIENAAMMYLSKYSYPDLELMGTIELGTGLHANSICADEYRNKIYVSNSEDASLRLIDVDTFTLEHVKKYNGMRLSGIAISPDGTRFAAMPTGGLQYMIYTNYKNMYNQWIASYSSDFNPSGNTLKQDCDASVSFIYQLCSNQNSQKYNGQFISVFGWNGHLYRNIYLPDTENELEGITRVNKEDGYEFVITDVVGNVFVFTPGVGQLSNSWFGQDVGTFEHGYKTRYFTNNGTVEYSNCGLGAKYDIPTRIQLPMLSSGAYMGKVTPICVSRCNGYLFIGSTTTSGLVRLNGAQINTDAPYIININYNVRESDNSLYLSGIWFLSLADNNAKVSMSIETNDTAATINTKVSNFWNSMSTNTPNLYQMFSSSTAERIITFDKISNGDVEPFTWPYIPTANSTLWDS